MDSAVIEKLAKLRTYLIKSGMVRETFRISDTMKNYISDPDHDKGREPWVVDIEDLTMKNDNFRSTEWTGSFFQMTVMSLLPGEEIGLEVHKDVDQFIRLEQGTVKVVMGYEKDNLDQEWEAEDDFAIFIPAGIWHNVINTGEDEVKIYSIYAEPEHPPGTIHKTKEEADKYEEEMHGHD